MAKWSPFSGKREKNLARGSASAPDLTNDPKVYPLGGIRIRYYGTDLPGDRYVGRLADGRFFFLAHTKNVVHADSSTIHPVFDLYAYTSPTLNVPWKTVVLAGIAHTDVQLDGRLFCQGLLLRYRYEWIRPLLGRDPEPISESPQPLGARALNDLVTKLWSSSLRSMGILDEHVPWLEDSEEPVVLSQVRRLPVNQKHEVRVKLAREILDAAANGASKKFSFGIPNADLPTIYFVGGLWYVGVVNKQEFCVVEAHDLETTLVARLIDITEKGFS